MQSVLAGILLALLACWLLWLAAWIVRVELHSRVEAVRTALQLRPAREGWLPRVEAHGECQGVPVRVRWSLGNAVRVRRVDGGWERVEAGDDLGAALRRVALGPQTANAPGGSAPPGG